MVGASHQSSGFPGGEKTGAGAALMGFDDDLATGAAGRGAEAAGEAVDAKFGALAAFSSPAIDEADPASGIVLEGSQLGEVAVVHHGDELLGFFFGVPLEVVGVGVDEFFHGRGGLVGEREIPPAPPGLYGFGLASLGAEEAIGIPGGFAGGRAVKVADVDSVVDGDDEDPGSGLGDEMSGVDDEGAELHAQGGEGLGEADEVVAGEEADDVFEDDDRRSALGLEESIHQSPEGPEGAAAAGVHAPAPAGKGEILAGEGGPGHQRLAGKFFGGDIDDVVDAEVIVAEVGGVDPAFGGVDIVGPEAIPGGAQAESGEAGAGEEFPKAKVLHDCNSSGFAPKGAECLCSVAGLPIGEARHRGEELNGLLMISAIAMGRMELARDRGG